MPPRRQPTDLTSFAPWIDWQKAVARVRRHKDDAKAIDALKRHLNAAVMLFEMTKKEEITRNVRRERINENARERVEAMAQAMAAASERDDWKEFIVQARALDAALHARRIYET